MLDRFGIDVTKLPSMTAKAPERILILDADGAAYRAAATVKTLPTALRRFCTEVLEQMFLTNSTEARLHLTAEGGFKGGRGRYPSFRPYQHNRSNKAKPALLEPLRLLLSTERAVDMGLPEEWYVNLHHYWEADDGCTMDSLYFGERSVVVSDDKDLRLVRGPYWEATRGAISRIQDSFGYIAEHPNNGTYPIGHGTKYFWLQMLMGDTADGIRGLDRLDGKLCGKVTAMQYLEDVTDENECANKVLWAYARSGQDALAEAQVLWMRRFEQDCAFTYLNELEFDKPLKDWVLQLNQYHVQYSAMLDAEHVEAME